MKCPKCDSEMKKQDKKYFCPKCGMILAEFDQSDMVPLPQNHPLNESGKAVILNEG